MQFSRGVLLTGSTGLLGRFLLRYLLATDYRVSVLVRDANGIKAADRIRAIVDWGSEALGHRLPLPTVVCGDIRDEGLGLTTADRRWLAVSCDSVIHSAANLSFRVTAENEPWATNVAGTRNLLELCRRLSISEFHQVSTAFVCGEADGLVRENFLERGQRFHNPYEESKYEAEQLIHQSGLHSTIYRPSVIIGDSRTGYTSTYHGFYRFIELAAKLSTPVANPGGAKRQLNLRLPFTGDEPRNLVPVDWVAQAIVQLVSRPECHGRTYHLINPQPTPARLIKEVAEQLLNLEGVRFTGREPVTDRSSLERLFFDHLDEYEPYHQGDPLFDCSNLTTALPNYPAPLVDRKLLTRLIEFAMADRWGKGAKTPPTLSSPRSGGRGKALDCRQYIEEDFPKSAGQSPLAGRVGLEVVVGLDVRGPEGGEWTLTWIKGELVSVWRGLTKKADVCYRMTTAIFEDVVRGKRNPSDAFFAQQIEVEGDVEKALKLAVLFSHFLAESPARPPKEVADAIAS